MLSLPSQQFDHFLVNCQTLQNVNLSANDGNMDNGFNDILWYILAEIILKLTKAMLKSYTQDHTPIENTASFSLSLIVGCILEYDLVFHSWA